MRRMQILRPFKSYDRLKQVKSAFGWLSRDNIYNVLIINVLIFLDTFVFLCFLLNFV